MNEAILVTPHNWSTEATLTPSPTNLTHHLLIPTRQATFIGAIVAIVFIFFGLIGNLILITTILSVKKLRSNIINIFIVSVRFDLNEKLYYKQISFSLLFKSHAAILIVFCFV